MNKGCCDEVFWVQQPGILLSWGCSNNGCDNGEKRRRGGAATWNDATKILIVLSIVLLILKVSWWWIVLIVGLLILIFSYYNTHPRQGGDGQKTCECSSNDEEKGELKEGYRNTNVVDMTDKFKYPKVPRNSTSSSTLTMPRPVPSQAYNYVDDDSGNGIPPRYVLAGNGRRGIGSVEQSEANRPRMGPKVIAPRDNKFRGGVIGEIDAPRVSVADRHQDDMTYETDIPKIEVQREQIEGIDKMNKKYVMKGPGPRIIREDPLQMYRDSILDEERDEANNEVERSHESSLSAVTTSFLYKH